MMKRIILLICALLFIQLGQAASKTIGCERFYDTNFWGSVGRVRTCSMRNITTIDSDEISVSPPDSTVLGLAFFENKNISFLPIKVDETFPNLVGYSAYSCSLKTVSKINFRNLKQLKILHLSHNQLKRINGNTFDDLTSLEFLHLYNNQIKQMNGVAFERLNELIEVRLAGNICMNKEYLDATAISISLVKDVNENCGFAWRIDLKSIFYEQNEQKKRIESLTEKVMEENKELLVEVAALKSKLAAADELKLQQENQIAMMTSMHSELKNSWELVCTERTRELSEIVRGKHEEIDELLEEQMKLRADVNERRTNQEQLEKKLRDLGQW